MYRLTRQHAAHWPVLTKQLRAALAEMDDLSLYSLLASVEAADLKGPGADARTDLLADLRQRMAAQEASA